MANDILRASDVAGTGIFSPFGLDLPSLPTARRSFVATRGRLMTNKTANTSNQWQGPSAHFATDDVTAIEAIYPNWYMNTGTAQAETAPGAPATISGYVEYPLGTFTQMTWGGSATQGTIPDGGQLSGFATVTIPRGALFRLHSFRTCSAGLVYGGGFWDSAPALGELCNFAATVTDATMNGNYTVTDYNNGYGPVAIVGQTRRRTFAFLDDSIGFGQSDVPNQFGDTGFWAKALGGRFGYAKMCTQGEALSEFMASGAATNRLLIAALASDAGFGWGLNDLTSGGQTPAQVFANENTLIANLKTSGVTNVWGRTLCPNGSSTDLWATAANQTPANAANIANITGARLKNAGYKGVFDVGAAVTGSATTLGVMAKNSGYWAVHSGGTLARFSTYDGTHPSPYGYDRMAAQVIFQ